MRCIRPRLWSFKHKLDAIRAIFLFVSLVLLWFAGQKNPNILSAIANWHTFRWIRIDGGVWGAQHLIYHKNYRFTCRIGKRQSQPGCMRRITFKWKIALFSAIPFRSDSFWSAVDGNFAHVQLIGAFFCCFWIPGNLIKQTPIAKQKKNRTRDWSGSDVQSAYMDRGLFLWYWKKNCRYSCLMLDSRVFGVRFFPWRFYFARSKSGISEPICP